MFTAQDYFDKDAENKSYLSAKEHLNELALLLDYLLDATVEKRFDGQNNIYQPSSIMTDEVAELIYNTAPSDRIKSVYDEKIKDEFYVALNHIRSREKATKDFKLPFVCIREEFNLTLFEELSLIISIAFSLDINRRNLYAFVANDAALNAPTTGVLYCIYQLIDDSINAGMVFDLVDNLGKMSVFFMIANDGPISKKSLMEIPLCIRDDVLAFLISTEDKHLSFPYITLYEYEKTGLDIFGKLSSYHFDGEGFIYIAADDSEDVFQFLREKYDDNILILDAELMLSDVKSMRGVNLDNHITHILSKLLFRMRTGDDILCIKMPSSPSDYSQLLLEVIKRYLPDKTIYICGSENFPSSLISSGYHIWTVDLPAADFEEREIIWNYFLKQEKVTLHDDINVSDLADCYEITFSKIRHAVTSAAVKARWNGENKVDSFVLKEELRRMGEAGFMSMAVFIPPVYSLENMEIDDTQKKIIQIACNRFKIKNRVEKKYGIKRSGAYGNGISVLLCGPPGTGKTMAAQVISKELSLPLYRVNLSQIISKYIGETQKNINEIFNQARKTNVILFFDEADALFSKRTDVKDSNDKYANAETAYLLQKVEGHSGMTILATNLFSNFDVAFVRRLSYVVHLEKPNEATRLKLWKSILPDTVELSKDIDFEFFANHFDFSGSEIKGILYSAMYMAEAEGKPLGNGHIAQSIQLRPEKYGSIDMAVELGKYSGFMLT